MDAAGGRQKRFIGGRNFPQKTLPENAAHDAALCHREISRDKTAGISEGKDSTVKKSKKTSTIQTDNILDFMRINFGKLEFFISWDE